MATESARTSQLKPFTENVRKHYDLSNEFYELFLDPVTMGYSSGRYERPGMTLAEGQVAKVDNALEKTGVQPGQRIVDIGFGWGFTVRRAAEKYGAHAIGLTLSQAQYNWVQKKLAAEPVKRGSVDIRIQAWEQFEEPVDAIITLEVFEHFRKERYGAFFQRCYDILSSGGRMLLQTNLWNDFLTLEKRGIEITPENVSYAKFIRRVIFPGGQLCSPGELEFEAKRVGFDVVEAESLAEHYIPTLESWAGNLEANRQRAIELTSQEVYDNYMRYILGARDHFRTGHIEVMQFTCAKP